MDFLGIKNVITVCYHDTVNHKPHPEPLLEAVKRMKDQKEKRIIVIGDEEKDAIAAKEAGFISILAYWGNHYTYYSWNKEIVPDIFCRDEESLLRFFKSEGLNLDICSLRKNEDHIFNLFDYYPISRTHDQQSRDFFDEIKGKNDKYDYCNKFCRSFEKNKYILPDTYGVFVVPSSTAGKWNSKLEHYVTPQLVERMGLINCSNYILRHTTHEKQAFGGNREVLIQIYRQ